MSGGRRTDVLVIVLISFRAPCTAWMAVALVAAIAVVTGKEIGRDRIQEGERERERERERDTQTDRRSTKEVKNEHSLCSRSRSLARRPLFASKCRWFLDGAFAYRIDGDHAIEEGAA